MRHVKALGSREQKNEAMKAINEDELERTNQREGPKRVEKTETPNVN